MTQSGSNWRHFVLSFKGIQSNLKMSGSSEGLMFIRKQCSFVLFVLGTRVIIMEVIIFNLRQDISCFKDRGIPSFSCPIDLASLEGEIWVEVKVNCIE